MRTTKLMFLALAAALALLALPAVSQAKARDRDHDGLPDKWEKHYHLSTHKNSANADPDRDHVDNGNEFREGTNPRKRDTNGNGRPDGREDRDRDHLVNAAEDTTGNDPIDKDTDNDGIPDGQEQAGVVGSFNQATGDLRIDLAGGGSVTGKVTNATEVECKTESETEDQNDVSASHDGNGEHADREHGDGEHGNGEHGDGEHGDQCPAGALKEGARVHEAELSATSGGPVWEKIELLTP